MDACFSTVYSMSMIVLCLLVGSNNIVLKIQSVVFVIFGSLLSVEIIGLLSLCVCASCLSVVVVFCQSYFVYTLYYLRGE